jgi:catechol 2,3-dioxygenase-like lactoylglutathione lyase family enzyme
MKITGFTLAVPSPEEAETQTRALFGDRASRLLRFAPVERAHAALEPPRVVDAGCNHMCIRVADIDAASRFLVQQPGVVVLGSALTVPDGALAGFRWQYFRMPWGGFFEVQQWARAPRDPRADGLAAQEGLDETAGIPTAVGFDHAGFAVADLERAVTAFEAIGGKRVLGSVGTADRAVMLDQFELDATDTLRMAMIRVGDVNFELFQHDVADLVGEPQRRRPPGPVEPGGSVTHLDTAVPDDVAAELRELGVAVAGGGFA